MARYGTIDSPLIRIGNREAIAAGRCYVLGDSFSTIRRTGGTNDVNGRFNNSSGYNYIDKFIACFPYLMVMDLTTNFAREGAYCTRDWSPAPAWSAINPIPSLDSQITQLIAANPIGTITKWDLAIVALGTNDGINPDGGVKPTDAQIQTALLAGLNRLVGHGFRNIFYIYPESKHQPTLATTLMPALLTWQANNRNVKFAVAFWDQASLNQLNPYLDGTHPNERAGTDMAIVMMNAWETRDTTNRLVQKSDPKLRVTGNFWEHSPGVVVIENVASSPAPLLMGRIGGVDKIRIGPAGSLTIDTEEAPIANLISRPANATGRISLDTKTNGANIANTGFSLLNDGAASWTLASYRPSGGTGFSFGFFNEQAGVAGDRNAIFLTNNNRVGFATSAPTGRLHINNPDDSVPGLRIDLGSANNTDQISFYRGGTLVAQIWSDGTFNSVSGYRVGGNQVMGSRIGGWAQTSTGGSRAAITTASSSAAIAAALIQLISDLKTQGSLSS